MIIDSIELADLIPLSHTDIAKLTIKTTAPIQIIIGTNGSGKSSILNEITRPCSSKPLYKKTGYRLIKGHHEEDTYKVVSDFGCKQTHNLIKNDETLNISGTTHTQIDLCEANLGITPIIEKLINFKYKICSMSKGERKQFFLSVHPSDLSFILQDHKRISSELRGFKSNLKMLKERELNLTNKCMAEVELRELYKLKRQLDQDHNILDKIIYKTNHEIDTIKKSNSYVSSVASFYSLETLEKRCLKTSNLALQYRWSHPHLFTEDKEGYRQSYLQNIEVSTHKKHLSMDQLLDNSERLKSDITELEETNTDIEAEIQQLSTKLTNLNGLIAQTKTNKNIPILNDSQLQHVETTTYPKCKILIDELVGMNLVVMSRSEIEDLKTTIRDQELSIVDRKSTIERLHRAKEALIRRRAKESRYTFPIDCDTACELKTNTVSILERTDQEISQIDDEITRCTEIQATYTEGLKNSVKRAENIHEMVRFLDEFELLFKNHFYTEYVFEGKKLTDMLNNCPNNIVNNLILLSNNTKAHNCKVKYENQLQVISMKLKTLNSLNVPTKEHISKSIVEKQYKLDRLSEQHLRLKQDLQVLSEEKIILEDLHRFKLGLIDTYKQLMTNSQQQVIHMLVELYTTIVKDCVEQKNTMNTTLREIEATIHEQESYQIRLNDEVLPSIKETEMKIDQWSQVEQALSPARGLPHVYMVRYLNNLITNANILLASICGYPLKINKLDPNKGLDFTLPVTVRDQHKVPDVSRCSDGQKQMIDLVWTIVTCQQTGINKTFPLILDEPDSMLSQSNRLRLLELLTKLVQQGDISQLFLVNHHAALQGMGNAEVFCVSTEGIALPHVYNEHVTIN